VLGILTPKIKKLLYKRDLGNMDIMCEYRLYKIQSMYKQVERKRAQRWCTVKRR